ncbi:MAG: virulence-associated E family protein, partial [Eudoraea sp.]|nr:virulence-associated E family protein [Eudoraea sp.]
YKHAVLKMWFLQCIAALDASKRSPLSHDTGLAVPKYEYILVFVGTQGIQKTKFIKSLLPNSLKQYILTGHELDTKDKDNIKIAISHWITELGELDSTFKKSDISSLKAFMSKEEDEFRAPYAAVENKYIRRTSFCGSVNDIQFLVDKTGNRRYLPLEVHGLNPLYTISVPRTNEEEKDGVVPHKMSDDYQNQQLWAEILHYYLEGEMWWPDIELERMLDTVVKGHERVDPIVEALESKFDLERNDEWRKMHGIRGTVGNITEIGEALEFATLNVREVCDEVGLNPMDARVTNQVSNYLKMNGHSIKTYKVDNRSKKAFRLCLHRGETLKSSFVLPKG